MLSQIGLLKSILQRLEQPGLLIYPVVAHAGILLDQILIPVIYLLTFIYIISINKFSRYRLVVAGLTALLCIIIYITAKLDLQNIIIYLPPILIPSWLAIVFLGSLRSDYALISKIAERMEGQALDRRHLLYTRILTALWGGIFLLMICEAVILAIYAPFEVWSWWVHIGNYIIIAVLFLIEMTVRHRFTGKKPQFFQMLQVLLQQNRHD